MNKFALIGWVLFSFSVSAQADLEAGKATSQMCVACHGVDGNAATPINPKLAGQHASYLAKQLHDFKLNMTSGGKQGRVDPVMSAMAMPLSEQDMANVAAYFASLPISTTAVSQQVADKGHALYNAGDAQRGITACVACHGPTGNGTELSGFPKISGQNAAYTKLQLEKFRQGQRSNDLNSMMRDIAKQLSDDDIDVLAEYLSGLH